MAKTTIVAKGANGAIAGGGTGYNALSESSMSMTTTESSSQAIWRQGGTFSNLYVRITQNSSTGAGTFNIRKNAANVNLTISITIATTGEFEDTTHTDAVTAASGEKWTFRLLAGTGGTTSMSLAAVCFDATTNTVKRIGQGTDTVFTAGPLTNYEPITGSANTSKTATETDVQWKCRLAGTMSGMTTMVRTNGIASASTLRLRKNTANGNSTISITASTTGAFEDTTNSDTIASGDLLNFSVATAATGTLAVSTITEDFITTDGNYFMAAISAQTAGAQATSLTRYYMMAGDINGSNGTTESTLQYKTKLAFTAKNMGIKLATNTISAASTFTLRKNAANTAVTISITASTTGFFEDLVNTESFAVNDEVSGALVSGGTGTSLSVRSQSFTTYIPPVTQTETGVARITATTTKTETGVGRIQKSASQTIDGKARVEKVVTQTEAGKARVQKSVSQTESGVARVQKSASQTIQGVANIAPAFTTQTQDISGVSRIQKTVTQTEAGKARITASGSANETGKARIEITTPRTEQGVSRVQVSVDQTEPGVSRITRVVTADITGVSRVTASATKTEDGVARIEKVVSRDETGVSRVTAAASQAETGKARVQKGATADELGIARIQKILDQAIAGVARIRRQEARTLDGKARIQQTTTQGVQGLSRINVERLATEAGRARISGFGIANITGKAMILAPRVYPYTRKPVGPYTKKAVSPFSRKDSPFTRKGSPYERRDSPYTALRPE